LCANLNELNKINIGAVSYLNTKPLIYGIKNSALIKDINLIEDYPAKIADLLINDKIDIGLVPVAVIPQINNASIISNYCIGAINQVASVCLFSDVKIENIEKVILDYQSRTSVELCKILFKHHWKINVEFIDGGMNFRNQINGTTAGIVIGDRAFEQRNINNYVYDLAEAWINFTSLPFVFAAWVSNKKMNQTFIDEFNTANAAGVENIWHVVAELKNKLYNLEHYYTKNISYILDDEKRKGLNLFLQYLKKGKK
jgi:chorismate dehydratase